MMGRSETAIITFKGTHIPPIVLHYNARYRCKPHHPTAQFCTRYLAIGHRADICPQVGTTRCKKCGTKLQTEEQDHPCKAVCVNCEGNHPADDPTCPIRREATKTAYMRRIRTRELLRENDASKHVTMNTYITGETEVTPKGSSHRLTDKSSLSRNQDRSRSQS